MISSNKSTSVEFPEIVVAERGHIYQQLRNSMVSVLSHTHTYSGRDDHGGTVPPPQNYIQLAEWARRKDIDALGMGSPYTPIDVQLYRKYDITDRHAYYNGQVDIDELMQTFDAESCKMLAEVNSFHRNRTHFFLDNETPKGRYGHMWWFGYQPDFPAWHDYDQDYDQWMCKDPMAKNPVAEPMPYNRRPYMQILAKQRLNGAVGCWAHPTSWWYHNDGRFITNIASEMPAHAFAEGFLDGVVVMGYHADRPEYRAIWFALLDQGIRATPVAEMDMSLSHLKLAEKDRVYLTYCLSDNAGESVTVDRLKKDIRLGKTVCTSGPLIRMTVDEQQIGSEIETSSRRSHRVKVCVASTNNQLLDSVELIGRNGRIWKRWEAVQPGVYETVVHGVDQYDYMVALVRSYMQPSGRYRDVAVSSPVYMLPQSAHMAQPMVSDVQLSIRSDSPFKGGTIQFEDPNGTIMDKGSLAHSVINASMPANGRITVIGKDGQTSTRYLINENKPLIEVQRYLYRGRFLNDFENLLPGEVPVEAWQLSDYRQAIEYITIDV